MSANTIAVLASGLVPPSGRVVLCSVLTANMEHGHGIVCGVHQLMCSRVSTIPRYVMISTTGGLFTEYLIADNYAMINSKRWQISWCRSFPQLMIGRVATAFDYINRFTKESPCLHPITF